MHRKDQIGPRAKHLGILAEQSVSQETQSMGLTPVQSRVLGFLVGHPEDPPCVRDVEAFFALSHPTVSGILSRLEEKGFLSFRADTDDGRIKRIIVSQQAVVYAERIRGSIDALEKEIVKGFTPEEKAQFIQYLDRAIRNLGGGPHKCSRKVESQT
ncbi:MAG: MarR family winged helix-turn-helix transcriptional regulator [Faecousia sp.]